MVLTFKFTQEKKIQNLADTCSDNQSLFCGNI